MNEPFLADSKAQHPGRHCLEHYSGPQGVFTTKRLCQAPTQYSPPQRGAVWPLSRETVGRTQKIL